MQTRRHFLSAAVAGAAWVGAAPWILGQTEGRKYRTALVGSGWWGQNILKEAVASGRSKVVALADPDEHAREVAADRVNDLNGDQPKTYRDYREMLVKEKPEVVIVASPDHWHSLHTIDALKAGAHVFVEKPTGHTIGESRAMLAAARAADRVVQVGLHRRIGPHFVSAHKFLKEGGVGTVGMVRMFVTGGGGVEKASLNTPAPETMDWDLWCGPAPMRPFNTKLHPGGWRNFMDYGNGQIGDWGVHWMDQVLAWTEEKYPRRVFASGGRPVRGGAVNDGKSQTSDAPDTMAATFEFESFTATWEHRQYASNPSEKHRIGCYFYGTKGVLHIGWRDGWTFYPENDKGKMLHQDAELQEPDGHNLKLLWADFLEGIEKRRTPVADIERGHRATTAVLLGVLSHKAGRAIQWDGGKEMILGDAEAVKLMRREYRSPWVYPEA